MTLAPRNFTRTLVRLPAENMGDGLTTQPLGAPDFAIVRQQYTDYLSALQSCGLSLIQLEADESFPDGHFVEDTAVLYGDLAIIAQPNVTSRRGEHAAIIPRLPHKSKVYISGDAFLDGGDVLFCADRVLIGLSQRTNRAGAEQLRAALIDYDTKLKVEFVPFSGVLHLKTGITELTPGVLLRSPEFASNHNFDFAEMIVLPHAESYAANVLPINGAILIPAGYPTVSALASRYYTNIFEVQMSEFQKMDGGLTCLSLLY